MDTPIYNFLKKYKQDNFIRLHMPAHKGRGILCEDFDITEIVGADSLFHANGIILESEKNAEMLFNTQKTLYSTQGSTLAIQTMLTLVSSRNQSETPVIVAVRNAHQAFINACVLLDLAVKWIYPSNNDISIASVEFSPEDIEKAILNCDKKPSAVYVTSPDYLGKIVDIKGISIICKKHGIPLLVDNAHGAYLNFLEENQHPIALGADMCCDSAHKTLPVLTGGGYLHISKSADISYAKNAKSVMALFASTSPSYLTLCSLDLCNKYLCEKFRSDLKNIIAQISKLKSSLTEKGYILCSDEPLKITIYAAKMGLYGHELAERLRKEKIECEYSDETHVVLMLSAANTVEEINRLGEVLLSIEFSGEITSQLFSKFEELPSGMSIRQAALSQCEEIQAENSQGRICSKSVAACPPGIPIVVSGEIITNNAIKIFKKYSISYINVVK